MVGFCALTRKFSHGKSFCKRPAVFLLFSVLVLATTISAAYAAGSVATYSDPGYSVPASSFYQGATVYSKLTGGLASKTYYAEYWGAGASPIMQSRSSALTTDPSGTATHNYTLARFAPVGSWDVRFLSNPLYANPRRAILDSPIHGDFQMNDTVTYKFHLEDRDGAVITTEKSTDLKVTLKVGNQTIWNAQNPSSANGWTFNSQDGTYTKSYTRSGANKTATAYFIVSGASTSAETGDAYFVGATPYLVTYQIFGTTNSYPYKLVIAKPTHEVTSGSVLAQFKLYNYTYTTEITSGSGITWTVQAKEANDYDGNGSQTTVTGSTPTYNGTAGYWESTFSLPAPGKYRFDIKASNSNAPEDTVIVNYAAKADFTVLDAPPTTTITLNPSSPNGGGGWYKTTPTITLTADEPATTYYQWDSTSGPWTTYTGTFNALEGNHTLYYYSVDLASNAEQTKNTVIKVDTTAPSITEQTPANATTVNSYRPTVSARLTDASSGVDSATILMKLDGTPVSHSYDPGTGIVSYTPTSDLTRGRHDVYVATSDVATNSASSSWHFTVFGTPVSGAISSNTTWTVDGSPYIVTGTIWVNSGITLNIEPGTIVKVEFGDKRIHVYGTLTADGTPASKIVFTSIKDDSYGGDTNNDGAATSPAAGDWQKITLSNSTTSILDNVVIKYGGRMVSGVPNEFDGALLVAGGSNSITNSTFSNNMTYSIAVSGAGNPTISGNTITSTQLDPVWYPTGAGSGIFTRDSASPTITGNTISSNALHGIYFRNLTVTTPTVINNTFTNNAGSAIYTGSSFPVSSGNSASGNYRNGISINAISGSGTWRAGDLPYVVADILFFSSGVTLTIEPGAIVKLETGGKRIRIDGGTLLADGTPASKIVFTSIKDDSYGGDTNNDGAATSPAAGDWQKIALFNSTTSVLDNVVVKYGGQMVSGAPNEFDGALLVAGGSNSITNSTFSNNMTYSIAVSGAGNPTISGNTITSTQLDPVWSITGEGTGIFTRDSASPTITGNTISSNALHGIYFRNQTVTTPTVTDNTFTNNAGSAIYTGSSFPVVSGNSATGNYRNGISINAISGSGTWRAGDLPYIITDIINVSSGVTLTIEPGTIVKFEFGGNKRIVVNGTLIADGTPESKIIFTSIRDDSYAGDTNNDGSATIPQPGNWENISLANSSSVIDNVVIKYGGRAVDYLIWDGTLYITGGSPSLTNSTFSDNMTHAIKASGAANPTISGNTITSTQLDPVWSITGEGSGIFTRDSASPVVHGNNIHGNAYKNIYNNGTSTINAEYNWWGSTANPSSTIYGPVDYDPWALSPYTGTGGGADPQGRYGSDTPCGYFGEPVNTATGNYTYEHEDLNIPGKGIPIQIVRSYNSQDILYNGPLGYGWTINYNSSLRFNSDESVTWVKPDGQRYTFTKNPDGSYNTPQGIFEVLTKNADSTYTLKFKDQSKYNFNASGYLSSQVDKHGNTTSFSYTSNQLTSVTDPGTRSITFTYTSNRITKIQDGTGRNVQYGYDGSGNLITFTDMNSKVTTFTYDSNHQLLTMREPEPSTNPFLTNHYDANGKVDWQKDAFLAQTLFAYDTVNRRTTLTDNRGKQTVHEFDDRYRLTKSTDPLLHSVNSAYGTLDVPSSVTNQNGKATTFTYDANGNTTSTGDPLHHAVTASYDLANNNLLWTKDALGRQTTYGYDPTAKLLTSIASPIGTTSFTYYTDGLLDTLTDANNHTTDFGYNSYGNLTSIHDALTKPTTFEYDTVGRMTASIDANNHKTQFGYDNQGNILTIKDPLAISDPGNRHQVDFTHDGNGNQQTFTDANNNLTQFGYDDMDNLTSVLDANNKTTSYGYDPNYNLHTVTDPLLHATTYDYYDDNKLWKITDPLLNVLQFNYDPVGNLTKTTYPNSNETYYSYYDDNLLNTVTYKNEPTSYTYTYNPTHTIDTVTDNNGKVSSYGYDNGNRLTSANDQTNPSIVGGFTVQRGYDGVSNLTSLIYAGTTYTYGYNARDDLTSLLLPAGTVGFVYDDARNRTDVNTPDSSNRHYTYNEANRTTQVRNTTNSGVQTFDYTHDGNGNIKSENAITYNYDALNRLATWVHEAVTTSYTYDDAGNLLQVSDNGTPVKTFTYNAANQITNTGFTYDLNGNMTSDGTYTYIYDGENRLKEVKQGANTIATYTYDYMGRRTSVTESGVTTYYHYDGWNVVTETDSSGATTATYTYDNRNQLVSMTRGGAAYYYQYNAHGDVVSLTNSLGQVVNSYTYDPWGKVLTANEQVANPYRYAGYRYDSTTELYYLQRRFYKPDIYRFTARDHDQGDLKEPLTSNYYVYCNDDPVNKIDPDGLWGSDLHGRMTLEIAQSYDKLERSANIIATANWAMDYPPGRLEWAHFDIPYGGEDSRVAFAEQRLSEAVRYAKKGFWELAMSKLGMGLHARQDYYAHIGPLVKHRKWWDDPSVQKKRFCRAQAATRNYLERFLGAI